MQYHTKSSTHGGAELNRETKMASVEIAVLILVFAIPAWLPIALNHQIWGYLKQSTASTAALTLFTVGEILQLIFVGCVGTGVLTLDYSLTFARLGIPVCILALFAFL